MSNSNFSRQWCLRLCPGYVTLLSVPGCFVGQCLLCGHTIAGQSPPDLLYRQCVVLYSQAETEKITKNEYEHVLHINFYSTTTSYTRLRSEKVM